MLSLQTADSIVLGPGRKGNQWLPLLQQQVQWELRQECDKQNKMGLTPTKEKPFMDKALSYPDLVFGVCQKDMSNTTMWSVHINTTGILLVSHQHSWGPPQMGDPSKELLLAGGLKKFTLNSSFQVVARKVIRVSNRWKPEEKKVSKQQRRSLSGREITQIQLKHHTWGSVYR